MKTLIKNPLFFQSTKILILFISGLYIIGFIYFPFLGVGNYQLVRVDFLLPSEWVILTIIAVIEIIWSIKLYVQLIKVNRIRRTENEEKQ